MCRDLVLRAGAVAACILLSASTLRAALPTCSGTALERSSDYQWFVASSGYSDADGDAESGSRYRWLTNGITHSAGAVGEYLRLSFDAGPNGANGESPSRTTGLAYAPGRWGNALALATNGGRLFFNATNNLNLAEGTIELWVALRAAGTSPAYTNRSHVLFQYRSPGGEHMQVAQSSSSGIIYAGGTVNGQWESAYGSLGNMRSWLAGEWHHLAFTFSAASNFMRLYLDGVLTAENNEHHYWAPDADGTEFSIGGDLSGNTAYYYVDEARISGRVAGPEEVVARARRDAAPGSNELWLSASAIPLNTTLAYEFTPVSPNATGAVCVSATLLNTGVPIINATPPSTLLPPGTTSLDLALDTVTTTSCAWSVGQPLPYAAMTPFAQGAGTTQHRTRITGLDPDSLRVNDVYVRAAAFPDYLFHLRYRSLNEVNPPYPRKGNLWGWWQVYGDGKGMTNAAKIDLWLGVALSASDIRTLRSLNREARVLTSINAVENSGLPPNYYLKDVNGNRIEVWPGAFRLNLTKPEVAEYQARFAYQTVLDSGLMADGCFFDNVMTTQSWQQQDIYGNPVQIDANEDGIADNPATFDAAWKAGVFDEIRRFRQLMPHAIVSGHAMDIYENGIAELFNGISIGFSTADVLEGEESFSSVFTRYLDWLERAVPPATTMVESSPLDQIAYGYDYEPLQKVPPSTLEFARSYYPWIRFGLAFTLMGDGFFAHEYGDTHHGNDWWYDELDFQLGYPLGPCRRVDYPGSAGTNLIVNPGFESAIVSPWLMWVNTGCAAVLTRDVTQAKTGAACARIAISATTGSDWHIDFAQHNRSLVQGVAYRLTFQAKASGPRPITLCASKGSPDWRNYGLSRQVSLTTNWQEFSVSFEALETVADSRIQFFLGASTGTVWIDDVSLTRESPQVFRRDFTHGIVLLNGTREPRSVDLEPGLRRITGSQAPLVEMILDDTGTNFSVTGSWTNATYDSGEWKATGPFYHAWQLKLHERVGSTGEARWMLPIDREDDYTLAAWWPTNALPTMVWSSNVTFQIFSNGIPVVATTCSQTTNGDRWNVIGTARLLPGTNNFVRLTSPAGACLADALRLWSAARYNNGQPATNLTLAPLDGIILKRDQPVALRPTLRVVDCSPAQCVLAAEDLTPGFTNELQTTGDLASTPWQTLTQFQATGSSVNITNGFSPQTNALFRLRVR